MPTPAPTPTVAAPAKLPADPGSVVRRYLEAIIGGNLTEAGALLAPGGTPKEAAFLDAGARITGVHVTRSDANGAEVQAEISAARGTYVATFHVTGTTIDQHDYIKL